MLLVQYRWTEHSDGSLGFGREERALSAAEALGDRNLLLGYALGEEGLVPVWTSSARDTAGALRREIPGVAEFLPRGIRQGEGGLIETTSGVVDSVDAVEFALALVRSARTSSLEGETRSTAEWGGDASGYDFEFSIRLVPVHEGSSEAAP
jgi:hypothetical protein